jgi:two-component system nitrogen regulation sensor histidine kinase GlnL
MISKRLAAFRRRPKGITLDGTVVLNALPSAVIVLDEEGVIQIVNPAAENLLDSSSSHLCGSLLSDFLPSDSPIFSLIVQSRANSVWVSEYGVTLDTPRIGHRVVNIQVAPINEETDWVVLSLQEQSIALKIGHQLSSRGAARSVTAMAAILAHEVKNPLSGIRGAAQLLEQSCPPEDHTLTRLICDEADRIVALVDRMEVFSDERPLEREAVNIHQVLEHVRRIAENGFARHVRFIEHYDPSLPPVFGNRDQLVQIFLNLIKNAAEAAPQEGGEIQLTTAYQHGIRLAVPGSDSRMHLPLVVSVQDNGPGIPDDIRPHLFDAFVTSKATGTGLGLALVAKIIGDHGGIVEFDSQPRRTVFRVLLPMVQKEEER